jgi:L-malate glycosyltransferase
MRSGRKKICIITPEYPPDQWGGLARTVERVSVHARDMGLETHVAQLGVDPARLVLLDENRVSEKIDGIVIHRILVGKQRMNDSSREIWDCPHTYTIRMMYQSLELLHSSEKFDLLHSFFLYPTGYVTGLLAHRFGIPSIVTIVGNDIKKYTFSPEKIAMCRIGLENAGRVVALSRDLLEMADAITPVEEKARIIYNSVRVPDAYMARVSPDNGTYRIGCAGIFKYAKGLPYLFKAVASIDTNQDLKLELRGKLRDSELAVFREMLERTGIKERVELLEPLDHCRVPVWLQSLDLFVLPSVSEGCPNILMEAMAAGVPSIATCTGAVENLMEDGVSGLTVPWGDSASLASAIIQMMNNPDKASKMGSAARDRMLEFSLEREFLAWKALYKELIEF